MCERYALWTKETNVRALIFRNSSLVVDDMPDPEPDEGQVLVKTLAAGICGSDVHIRDLAAQAPPGSFPEEVVWGHEFCCELLGYGTNTERKLKPGTRVCSVPIAYSTRGASMLGAASERPGGFAERMVLNESMLVPVPDGMPTEHAVLTEPMAVGWHAVEQSRVQPGDVPLVIGCGPVGLAVIAGLAIKGVHPIIAADFSPTRRKMAETMGADIVLDPADGSPYGRWQRELTPDSVVADASSQVDIRAILGMGPKLRPGVIFECVGVPGVIQQILDGAMRETRVVVVGVCMERDEILPLSGLNKQVSIQFSIGYTPQEFAQTLRHLADGRIDGTSWITGKVGLNEAAATFDDLKNPERHVKILIEPWR
jgi:threonine dehydrogenase-like Zn-dependent dehydrogenase